MNKLVSIFFIFFIWASFTCAYSQDDHTVLMKELEHLNKKWGYQIEMKIEESGPLESLPNQNIRMSLSELKELYQTERRDLRFYILRFVLAHEFAHQVQYYRYRTDRKFLSDDLVSKTLLETQADILAGSLFFIQSPELLTYMSTHPKLVSEIFEEIFKTGFELGSREHALGSHPSKRDRMLAIRLGLTNGLSYVLDQDIKANPTIAIQSGLTPETFKKTMNEQFRFIDLKKSEEIVEWSYRQAKKIINYDRKVSTNVILTTPPNERHHFFTDRSYPYVEYDLTYKNIGTEKIYIEMEVYVPLVDRKNPNSGETYRKLSVNHHKFLLEPNQEKSVSGKLNWMKNRNDPSGLFGLTQDEMPRIVYPHIDSDDAIYSSTLSFDPSNDVHQKNIKFLNFSRSTSTIKFRSFFNSLINAYLLEDMDIIHGMGEKSFYIPNSIYYLSSQQFTDGTRTTVLTDYSKKIKRIELEYPNFYPNADRMYSTYADLKEHLDNELNLFRREEDSDEGNYWVDYYGDLYNVYLEAVKGNDGKEHTIYLSIDFE